MNNLINPNLKKFIDEKIQNFINCLSSLIKWEVKKIELQNWFDEIQNNYFKILMFIIAINKWWMKSHIDEFIQKYEIDDNEENNNKISEYYNMFLEIKDMFNKK